MGFNKENLISVKEEFRRKNLAAKEAAFARLRELERTIPEFREIELGFSELGSRFLAVNMDNSISIEQKKEKLNNLELERKAMSEARVQIMTEHGYPTDYTAPIYECKACHDTGFVNSDMCDCMRRELVKKGYESSGLGALIGRQSFESFSLNYYKEGDERNYMAQTLTRLRDYAENFGEGSGNLLLLGGTGLGKTHLSTSVAKVVIDGGNDVVYETAQNILGDFESEHFGKRYERGELTSRYMECDLLMIDDLGTELSTQFTVSALYNLINTRLNRRLSMLINSNISSPAQLRERYTDRIVSRLFGEFNVFIFQGTDIRTQKLR